MIDILSKVYCYPSHFLGKIDARQLHDAENTVELRLGTEEEGQVIIRGWLHQLKAAVQEMQEQLNSL